METSLHRQLKALYAGPTAHIEQRVAGYRIDAVRDGQLVEIQHGGLAAIRTKIARLLEEHDVLVVKPLNCPQATGQTLQARRQGAHSKAKSQARDFARPVSRAGLFYARVSASSADTADAPRGSRGAAYPGHGRRRRWRRDDHVVEDQRLVAVVGVHQFQSAADLFTILPGELPATFHSGHVADALDIHRWIAQRIVYCLRQTGAAEHCGKSGNTLLYRRAA